MLDALKFVQGAISNKTYIPEMKHFVIEDGSVRAFNGILSLSSPIDFAVPCKPQAQQLVYAIRNCEDVVSMEMLHNGRLRIQSGKFKAFVDCVATELPSSQPQGDILPLDGEAILEAFKVLSRFVGNDASRPWSNGILLRGQSAYATNNVCLVEFWHGSDIPFPVNIPEKAIEEALRIGKPPERIQMAENSITLHYEEHRWIKTQLLATTWPDLNKILDVESNPEPIPEGLFEGLEVIKPFQQETGYVYFKDGQISTHKEDAGIGASYDVDGIPEEGVYKVAMMSLLKDVAHKIDFSLYPRPLIFYGDRLRGAIVGVRA